jgi:uncharacterized membrane protein (UPF0127 family)
VQSQKLCVFNVTRQSFLSLGVNTADTHLSRLRGLLGRARLRGDEGLWVVPCQGIHTFGVLFPLDVIFLDENYRVVHLIEHLSPFRFSPVRMQSSSVLELPSRTVFWSGTHVGDQVLICSPEELAAHWGAQRVVEGGGMINDEETQRGGNPRGLIARMAAWFRTSTHRRRTPRLTVPEGCGYAYYWEGGAPIPHPIVNISEAGAFFKTETVWRSGTIIELALQRNPCDDGRPPNPQELVRVAAKVMRCEPAGTAVEFIYTDPRERERMRAFLAAVQAGKS